jgi:putative monooxygenase
MGLARTFPRCEVAIMTDQPRRIPIVSLDDLEPVTISGGSVYPLLTPTTVGSTTGNMGVLRLNPGEWNTEHIHPYSEEYVMVLQGPLAIRIDDVPHTVKTHEALIVPIGARHRLSNDGETEVLVVYTLAPLPPPGEAMQVFTEPLPTGASGESVVY